MYKSFYNLKEKPFNITPDPNFLYLSSRHKEALSYLAYGINQRCGFLQITGEIGTGKTTLCRALLNQLDQNTKSAFILNPSLSGLQLLQQIVEDFGLDGRSNRRLLTLNLNKFLLAEYQHAKNVVLIIDEAQDLKPSTLEDIRLLSNLETEKEKLFQIVLVGQPQLRDILNSHKLAQLKQRIALRFHITPLDSTEVAGYINHRLIVAGSSENDIKFDSSAVEKIYEYSNGIPRLINIVCDRALLCGYVMQTRSINNSIIKSSIEEIEGVMV